MQIRDWVKIKGRNIAKDLFYTKRRKPRLLTRIFLLDPFQQWCHRTISSFLSHGDVVLDVGCREFPFTCYPRVKSVYGIDLMSESEGYLGWTEKSLKWIREIEILHPFVANAEQMPFADASFDKAILIEVIEHIEHDDTALKEIARVLKPAGAVLFSTPNGDEVPKDNNPYHLRHYSSSSFKEILQKHFDDVHVWKILPWLTINELPWYPNRSAAGKYFFIYLHRLYQFFIGQFIKNKGYHLAAICRKPKYAHSSSAEAQPELLVCPESHEPLIDEGTVLSSKYSKKIYQKKLGVPILLTSTPHHQNKTLLFENRKV